jgi:Dolichyl-phosphate-mannose-protein mannosyltransferase
MAFNEDARATSDPPLGRRDNSTARTGFPDSGSLSSTPHWDYRPWFHKPPLYEWSTAIFFRLFGISEFWARSASALSGVAVAALTYLIGRTLCSTLTGLLAVAILLTSYGFLVSARSGMTDVILTMFIYLAIYSYLRLERGNGVWWYPLRLSCALALLTKSTAALVAPAAILVTMSVDGQLPTALRSRHLWQGLALALRHMPLNHQLPVIVYSSQSVHSPSLLFYSDLPVEEVYDRKDFDNLFASQRERSIVPGVDNVRRLKTRYDVRVLRRVGIAVYASVSWRSTAQVAIGGNTRRGQRAGDGK